MLLREALRDPARGVWCGATCGAAQQHARESNLPAIGARAKHVRGPAFVLPALSRDPPPPAPTPGTRPVRPRAR